MTTSALVPSPERGRFCRYARGMLAATAFLVNASITFSPRESRLCFVVPGWHHDRVTDWHPVMATTEPEPGVWLMRTPLDYGPFGRIELRRVQGGLRYRVEFRGELLGWSTTLQVACERLWAAYLEKIDKDRRGPPNGLPSGPRQ